MCELSRLVMSSSLCSLPGSFAPGIFQEDYWSRVPFLSPGGLPDPGTEPGSFSSPSFAGRFFTIRAIWEALNLVHLSIHLDLFFPKYMLVFTSRSKAYFVGFIPNHVISC